MVTEPLTAHDDVVRIACGGELTEENLKRMHALLHEPSVVGTGTWSGPKALRRLKVHNAKVQRVHCRIEKVFGTCKRSYGLGRMCWIGYARDARSSR